MNSYHGWEASGNAWEDAGEAAGGIRFTSRPNYQLWDDCRVSSGVANRRNQPELPHFGQNGLCGTDGHLHSCLHCSHHHTSTCVYFVAMGKTLPLGTPPRGVP